MIGFLTVLSGALLLAGILISLIFIMDFAFKILEKCNFWVGIFGATFIACFIILGLSYLLHS